MKLNTLFAIMISITLIISVLGIALCFNLENKIKTGKVSVSQIRVIRKGSVYIIDDIEGLGRNKHFISFKEE